MGVGFAAHRAAGGDGAVELEELLAGPDREPVVRVRDDVGVLVRPEREADRYAPRTCLRVVVGGRRHAGGVGEAHDDGRRACGGVGRARQRSGAGRRSELTRADDALRVNGTESGMIARELGQGVEDAGDQRARRVPAPSVNPSLFLLRADQNRDTTKNEPAIVIAFSRTATTVSGVPSVRTRLVRA